MMSDRTLAVLELIVFVLLAAVGAALVWILTLLIGVIQAVAVLGGTFAALVAGSI